MTIELEKLRFQKLAELAGRHDFLTDRRRMLDHERLSIVVISPDTTCTWAVGAHLFTSEAECEAAARNAAKGWLDDQIKAVEVEMETYKASVAPSPPPLRRPVATETAIMGLAEVKQEAEPTMVARAS